MAALITVFSKEQLHSEFALVLLWWDRKMYTSYISNSSMNDDFVRKMKITIKVVNFYVSSVKFPMKLVMLLGTGALVTFMT